MIKDEARSTEAALTLEQAAGQMLLAAFEGHEPPPQMLDLLRRTHIGGVTLFRSMNVQDPAQVRSLTAALQRAAAESGQPPLLVCADQEGGQLLAIAGTTPFPGNMALGATRSTDLARRAGSAVGRELAAMGINVNYAPVCDVNVNPRNPVVGTRSFGADPSEVGRLAAAMIEGLQEAGVAATAKHFPGHGDTATDSHYGTPVLTFDEERLRSVELPPFGAAIDAGTRLMMTAHIALPGMTNGLEVPATLSPQIMKKLLREELGFQGVVVSDAMNMGAIEAGLGLVVDCIAAANAGVDLLLLADCDEGFQAVYSALLQAARRGLLPPGEMLRSAMRVLELKSWLANREQPGLEVVNSKEHRTLAYDIAARSVTLVRDNDRSLPLHLGQDARVAVILPRPANLTPADTSSYDRPVLTDMLRRYHPNVDQIDISIDPNQEQIGDALRQAEEYDLILVGTINAFQHTGQAALVNKLLERTRKVIAVALRLPYDLETYPGVPTYICTYNIQPPSMEALADALWGRIPFAGSLPVMVEGA
ncbi:MAG TPA: glycoside hydrolase family 3 protein [Chloroflexia bacterium]|nr:glycoside hydrolase family 3 protein [Chloroflexia bacterium]